MSLKLTLPGQLGKTSVNPNQSLDSDFDFVTAPSTSRADVTALLPGGSHVPVPFEPTPFREHAWGSRRAQYVDPDWLSGEYAVVAYTPTGEITDQESHLACRVTLADEEHRTPRGIQAHHKQVVWEGLSGDPDREIYSDWVTTTYDTHTANGHQRTVYTLRAPRLVVESLSSPVSQPVRAQAFVVQSIDWGVIEVGAHLTPDPAERRVQDLVESVADTIAVKACEYTTPEADLA